MKGHLPRVFLDKHARSCTWPAGMRSQRRFITEQLLYCTRPSEICGHFFFFVMGKLTFNWARESCMYMSVFSRTSRIIPLAHWISQWLICLIISLNLSTQMCLLFVPNKVNRHTGKWQVTARTYRFMHNTQTRSKQYCSAL